MMTFIAEIIIGILKISILTAGLVLIICSFFFEKNQKAKRWFKLLFYLMAFLSISAFFNFGLFHYGHGLIHHHEQYHFFMGSKYLNEVRYDNLYKATAVSLKEKYPDRSTAQTIRDPLSFNLIPFTQALDEKNEIKKRFTRSRWEEFQSDLDYFIFKCRLNQDTVLNDFGNTGSPSWAVVVSIFTKTLPLSFFSMNVFAILDIFLLLILLYFIVKAFGMRTFCVAVMIGMMTPRVYDWLGGSILRMDWIFSIGMCICLYKMKNYWAAGAFLGYAISSKIFCVLFAFPLGIKYIIETIRHKKIQKHHLVFILSAITGLVVFIFISIVYFGGISIWKDYISRIIVTQHEKYYCGQFSFRDIFLQFNFSPRYIFDFLPNTIAAALPQINISDYFWSFLLARIGLIALLSFSLARQDEVFSFGIGVLFIYITLVVNIYYYQMLLFWALSIAPGYKEDYKKVIYLSGMFILLIISHLVERYSFPYLQGYIESYYLLAYCLVFGVLELRSWRFERAGLTKK